MDSAVRNITLPEKLQKNAVWIFIGIIGGVTIGSAIVYANWIAIGVLFACIMIGVAIVRPMIALGIYVSLIPFEHVLVMTGE